MHHTVFEQKITRERGRGEKRRRSLRTSTEVASGRLSLKGASAECLSRWTSTCSPSPPPTDILDQSAHHIFTNQAPKADGPMPGRRSVSPQGASSGSSSPQRSPSPAASPAASQRHQPLSKRNLSPQRQSVTSALANRREPSAFNYGRKHTASAPSRNHVQVTAGPLSIRPGSRYGINITNFDFSVPTFELQQILKHLFSRFGKLISFAFHGKLDYRYCRLSYASEEERNKALAVAQNGPLQLSFSVEPWENLGDPSRLEPNGFGIKIANISFIKKRDIISRIKDAFKKFGVITYVEVVGDNEDRYVQLFYSSKYAQEAALSTKNRFSAKLGAIRVSPLSNVSQNEDIKNVKFQKDKTGSPVKRQRMDPLCLSSPSAKLRRDIGARSAIPASNPFPVTNVLRQTHNATFSPSSRPGPNMSWSSTNLPNAFNHTRDRNSTERPFHRGAEYNRTWSPSLNLPFNSQQICTHFGPAIKGQPDFVKSPHWHERKNALSSPKPPSMYGKTENITVPNNYGTLVRSGASASHHKASLTLWVNNLDDKTTERELGTIFQPFGKIQHIEIREGFRNTGKQAFLQYLNLSSVYEAIQQMDGKYLGSAKLQLDFAYPHQPTNSIWVCGGSSIVNRSNLENIFKQFGPVVKVLHDSVKNTSLVLYNNTDSAVKAVNEINTLSVFGHQVKLGFANRRCQLGFCHSMESSGQNVGDFYQLVGDTSEWLLRKANIERLLTLPS